MSASQLDEDVRKLRQGLGPLPEPAATPFLVMVSGLPGTGKSYFCRRLAERVPLAILESDTLRRLLFSRPAYTGDESCRLFNACHGLVEDLLKHGVPLAFDATNLEESNRERLYHIADRLHVDLVLVRIDAPAEVVYERLRRRAGGGGDPEDRSEADECVYERMKSSVQRIRRSHFVVDTSKDITPAVNKVARRLRR